ncbi:MAG: endonuclease/exonuclease/phosphatase family protein, partial [Clostridia bacterium]|nr:endonuclease/exonuclease/phosphatase family protein [Clostridia bacterium]
PWWAEKGLDCSAEARVGSLLRVYRETMPDVIGGQEFSTVMADLMKQGFVTEPIDYTLIWGRYTPILYRADKLELLDSEFFTYPERIDGVDGTFNDSKSKAYNIGVFRVKATGKRFIFATTHLWWKHSPMLPEHDGHPDYQPYSDEAREYQIHTLVQAINRHRAQYDCPAFLVGDLNAGYDSKAVQYALANGFRHAHDIATEFAEESVGYHYCFGSGFETEYYDKPFEWAVDHILVSGEPEGTVKRFERYSPEYYLPISDHSPAYVDVVL